jgi:hypothetical protein
LCANPPRPAKSLAQLRARHEAPGLTQAEAARILQWPQPHFCQADRGARLVPERVASRLGHIENGADAVVPQLVADHTVASTQDAPTEGPIIEVYRDDAALYAANPGLEDCVPSAVVYRVAASRAASELRRRGVDVHLSYPSRSPQRLREPSLPPEELNTKSSAHH